MSDTTTTELWTYIGRRLTSKGLGFAFIDQNDDVHLFVKRPKSISYIPSVGSQFDVDVTRDDEGGASVIFDAYRGYVEDDPRVTMWAADSRALETVDELEKLGKRAAANGDALAEHLRTLNKAYRSQVGPARKAAFLANVIEAVTR